MYFGKTCIYVVKAIQNSTDFDVVNIFFKLILNSIKSVGLKIALISNTAA